MDNNTSKDLISSKIFFIFSIFTLFANSCVNSANVHKGTSMTIVQQGMPTATIVISPNCSYLVEDAVKDMQLYIEKMSGAKLPISRSIDNRSGNLILVGRMPEVNNLVADLDEADIGIDGFVIKSLPGKLIITGKSDGYIHKFRYKDYDPQVDGIRAETLLSLSANGKTDCGTPNAVYFFLETLGCRWYMPGESGEFVPKKTTIEIPAFNLYSKPDFSGRDLGYGCVLAMGKQKLEEYAIWLKRNRICQNTYRQGHSLEYLFPREKYSQSHPEYFALVDGKRDVSGGQLCLSNSEVVETVYANLSAILDVQAPWRSYPVGQYDTWVDFWCKCDKCLTQYGDKTFVYNTRESARNVGVAASTETMINYANGYLVFINKIAEKLEQKHPDCLITYYALYNIPGFPKAKPRDNVMPGMCHIVPGDKAWRDEVKKWEEVSKQLHYYSYMGWRIAFPRLSIGDDIRWCHQHKGVAMYLEQDEYSPISVLTMYLGAKAMWDTNIDAKEILAEFYKNYYGAAEQPMRMFYETFDNATKEAVKDYDCYYDYPQALVKVVDKCREYLNQASAIAEDSVVKRRIDSVTRYWKGTQLHVKAQKAMEQWRKEKSAANKDAARAVLNKAIDFCSNTDELYIKSRIHLLQTYMNKLNKK